MMVWPSGSPLATRDAPMSPPAPSQFSTITDWPRLAVSFSATMRAMVSEALPGVTPEMRRTVLLGKVCAAAMPETSMAAASKIQRLRFKVVMVSSPVGLQILGKPSCPASQSAVRLR